MQTLAFDGRMGASGDMLLGALIDAGGNPALLEPIESAIDVTYQIEKRTSHGLEATGVTVTTGTDELKPVEGHSHHRSLEDVFEILDSLALESRADGRARDAFRLLAEAEAAVHGASVDTIHFHEVGADDAIADIAGVAVLLSDLSPDRIITTPVAVGGGEIDMSHGRYPIPPPAVLEIAKQTDLTIVGGPEERELLTPTGAALLGEMAESVESLPALSISTTGYGIGTHEFRERPNVVRAYQGTQRGSLRQEEICVLETNVDDVTPEVLGHLYDRMIEAGARDVSILPLSMKKSRPGHLIRVIAHPNDAERLARLLATETGSLGIRSGLATHRWVAERRFERVEIEIDGTSYDLSIKIGYDTDGTVIDRSVEFDEAATIADETGRPVRDIIRVAEHADNR